ncbi:hypothetical protein GCM10022209_25000 [Chitinophaga oryziterrae]
MEILLKDKDYRANVKLDTYYKIGYADGKAEAKKEMAIKLKEVGLVTEQMLDDYLKVRYFRKNLRLDIFYDMGHRDGKTEFRKHMARKMKGLGYANDLTAKVTNIPARRIAKY